MTCTKNTYGNVISFFISAALHGLAVYLIFATFKSDIFLAEKNEAPKAMAINLNQISPNDTSNNDMQASQVQTPESNAAEAMQEVKQEEPPKEQVKEPEPVAQIQKPKEPEPIKEQKPAPKPKPKPKKERVKEPLPEPAPRPPERIAQPLPTPTKEPSPMPPTPASAPSSQNLANNEAVNQGGSRQSGESASFDQASARTILGEIYGSILKHKTYPKRAINGKMEGRVGVRFLLKGRCDFEILEITQSCGHDFLDRHSLNTIKKACEDFPDEAIGMDIKVPIVFNLRDINE
ncbi:TonB family protein [Campylobacter curvus]|uniref:Energy transduction protein TonB n=1 Tax=Campylobacter curvus (strain 525.92) TaxID=360105 RepID=A7GZT2_CAMC5|nr:TonB family protein [Campylobacter curvus]ABS50403.1 energy transduction protein TonB [Campylobacter curvus 525.92]